MGTATVRVRKLGTPSLEQNIIASVGVDTMHRQERNTIPNQIRNVHIPAQEMSCKHAEASEPTSAFTMTPTSSLQTIRLTTNQTLYLQDLERVPRLWNRLVATTILGVTRKQRIVEHSRVNFQRHLKREAQLTIVPRNALDLLTLVLSMRTSATVGTL